MNKASRIKYRSEVMSQIAEISLTPFSFQFHSKRLLWMSWSCWLVIEERSNSRSTHKNWWPDGSLAPLMSYGECWWPLRWLISIDFIVAPAFTTLVLIFWASNAHCPRTEGNHCSLTHKHATWRTIGFFRRSMKIFETNKRSINWGTYLII